MDKITYLAELAEGLARWVPERERQDILRYYAEYFEEAGIEREAEVVAELGDPWALSSRLAVEGGYVTWEKAASWTPRKRWPRVLLGVAAGLTVFTLVFGIGLLALNNVTRISDPPRYVGVAVIDPEQTIDWGQVSFVQEGMGLADFYYKDAGSLEVFDAIDVDISLGNIEVVAGDDYTLSVRRNNSLTGYGPVWEVTDGVLRLRDSDLSRRTNVDNWDDLKNMFSMGQWAVDVTITVPETAMLHKVSVKTGLGDVLLWGVDAETVTAETGMGDVVCYEARSVRWLGLSTGMGDVNLGLNEVRSGLNAGLKSGMGDIEVSMGCFEEECAYELESGLGSVTVNGVSRGSGARRKGSAVCSLDAGSGTGCVNVYFN